MIAHISADLQKLASYCCPTDLGQANGWTIDEWELDGDAEASLLSVYHSLIAPPIDPDILDTLRNEGVDEAQLFFEDNQENDAKAKDRVTRSDLTELAAAASLLAVEGIPITHIHLPNVPKGSRRQSASGIDVLSVLIEPTGDNSKLADDEALVVCSVKHTISDCADLRRKLMDSLTPESLSIPYLLQQIRVLHGRLQERGIDVDRIFLLFSASNKTGTIQTDHLQLIGVGAVDTSQRNEFRYQINKLKKIEAKACHLRQVLIPGLSKIHGHVGP